MKVLVAVPTKRGMLYRLASDSIFRLEWDDQLDIIYLLGGDHNPLYWNNLLEKWNDARAIVLNGDYDALLTVESDIILPPDALKKLATVDADVVYGLFALRIHGTIRHPWNVSTSLNQTEMTLLSDDPEAARASWGKVIDSVGHGQGICLIYRRVLEKIEFKTLQPVCHAPDWDFSIDCQREGFTQKHHLGVVCGHIRPKPFWMTPWPNDRKAVLEIIWPDPEAESLYRTEPLEGSIRMPLDSYTFMRALYGQFVKGGDLVFNVGANVGERTQVFLELGADVVAVEPQPQMCAQLHSRFGDNIAIVEAAAGPKEGEVDLWLCTDDQLATCAKGWAEALKDRWPMEKWHKKITVPMVTLDGLIQRYGEPDFCKIDVEGYEIEVLKGLSRPLKALCFECTIPYIEPALECVDYVAGLGMKRFNYIVREQMNFQLPKWVGPEKIKGILRGLPESTFFGDIFAVGSEQ